MLTARDEEVDKVLGLELGADDYMVKPFSLRELISRIRALLRRAYGELATAAAHERLAFGPITIDMERLLVLRDGQPIELTPIEFRLLRYLASNPGRPFGREQLIEAVWATTARSTTIVPSTSTCAACARSWRRTAEPRWLVTVRGIG